MFIHDSATVPGGGAAGSASGRMSSSSPRTSRRTTITGCTTRCTLAPVRSISASTESMRNGMSSVTTSTEMRPAAPGVSSTAVTGLPGTRRRARLRWARTVARASAGSGTSSLSGTRAKYVIASSPSSLSGGSCSAATARSTSRTPGQELAAPSRAASRLVVVVMACSHTSHVGGRRSSPCADRGTTEGSREPP